MAVVHQTVVYDVHDFKVFALTADTGGGGSPTYDAPIDVPGISQVSMDPNIITAELKGDATIIAQKARIDKFNLSATYGKIDIDVLEVILGGEASDPTAGEARYDYLAATVIPYFGCTFKMEDVETEAGIDDLHVVLYKCKITGGTLVTGQSDQFSQPSFTAEAIKPTSMTRMLRVRMLDTVTDITAMV